MTPISTTFSTAGVSATPVLWLRGEHDMATAVQVHEAIETLAQSAAAEVVVDMGDVDFMDVSIVRVLVAVTHDLEAQGRRLCCDPLAKRPTGARAVRARRFDPYRHDRDRW